MRTFPLAALGAVLLMSGCSVLDGTPKPAAYTRPENEAWMLVTPPERLTVLELRESLERLPSNGAPLPAASGEVEVDRLAVQAFYERLQAAETADAKAGLLVRESLHREAPVTTWHQVRKFRSEDHCKTTRRELQEITQEASAGVDYYPEMPLYELQWVFLEWSNRWSECIPVRRLEAAGVPIRG